MHTTVGLFHVFLHSYRYNSSSHLLAIDNRYNIGEPDHENSVLKTRGKNKCNGRRANCCSYRAGSFGLQVLKVKR